MLGAVFKGGRKVELMRFDDPTPGPGEAIIEIKASGMCGSDLHFYRNNPADVIRSMGFKDLKARGIDETAPIIGGHEPCGTIAAVGPGVDKARFRIGSRQLVFHYSGCSHCAHCRRGWTQMCDDGAMVYGTITHGGHAPYMKVPVSSLSPLPDEISFTGGAAISCGTGTAYGALVRLDVSARDTLAIFGLGPVGLSAAQLAHAMGVEVIGIDVSADRVARSRDYGVAHAIDASTSDPIEEILKLTGGKGVTCAMDCAGGEQARASAVRSTSPWGRIVLVAVGGELKVDAIRDVILRQRTIIGSYTFSNVWMDDCARFIADRGIEVDRLFTDHWKLEQAEEAYAAFDKQAGGKGVFLF